MNSLEKLAGEDKQFIIDMLLTFRRTTPPIIQRMVEFDNEKKYEALGREAHKLIPGVSFLGVTVLKDELIKIEEGAKNEADHNNLSGYVRNVREYVNELIGIFDRDFNLDQYD